MSTLENNNSDLTIPVQVYASKEILFRQIHAALETFTAATGLMVRDVSWSIHRAYAGGPHAEYDEPHTMRATIETK